MTTIYFDTSAFVKLLVAEAGSEDAARLWDAADAIASSRLLYPETAAALAAARRARRLTDRQHRDAKALLEEMWAAIHPVEVSAAVAESTASLAERCALRGYDAVHLASALAVRAEVLVASDAALATAALKAGVPVARPGA